MHRREFLIQSSTALAATWFTAKKLTAKNILSALASQPPLAKFSATDTVTLGSTGIKTSRLAMGTGTVGFGGGVEPDTDGPAGATASERV